MQGATVHSIRRATLGCFTPSEIHEAKSALLKTIPNDLKQHLADQVKSRRGSTTKPKEDAEVDDILDIFTALDQRKLIPVIHVPATELFRLPKAAPEDMAAVQVMERLANLESSVNGLRDTLTLSAIDNCSLKTRLDEVETIIKGKECTGAPHFAPSQLPTPHAPFPACPATFPGNVQRHGRSFRTPVRASTAPKL